MWSFVMARCLDCDWNRVAGVADCGSRTMQDAGGSAKGSGIPMVSQLQERASYTLAAARGMGHKTRSA
jgi:hypothetical protein